MISFITAPIYNTHWPKNFMACTYLLIFNNKKNHAKNEQQRSYFSFYNNRAAHWWLVLKTEKGKNSRNEKGNVCVCVCAVKMQQNSVKWFDAIPFTFLNAIFFSFSQTSWVLWFSAINWVVKVYFEICAVNSPIRKIYISLNKLSWNKCSVCVWIMINQRLNEIYIYESGTGLTHDHCDWQGLRQSN